MQNLLVFLATAEPSPGEDLREGLDPEMVTPGTLGFLATLFVVIAVIFLIRDMTKRIRRVRYREQVEMEADRPAGDDGEGTGSEAGGTSGEGTADEPFAGEVTDVESTGRGGSHSRSEPTERGGSMDPGDYDGGTDQADKSSDGATRRLKNSNGAGPDRKG